MCPQTLAADDPDFGALNGVMCPGTHGPTHQSHDSSHVALHNWRSWQSDALCCATQHQIHNRPVTCSRVHHSPPACSNNSYFP